MIRLRDILSETQNPGVTIVGEPHITNLIDQNLDYIAGEFAESSPVRIGGGYYGTAYRLASGRILKITADAAEVTTAMRRRHSVPHLMSYYDIRSIVSAVTPAGEHDINNTRFALLMDAVTPLTEAQQAIWHQLMGNHYFNPLVSNSELERRAMPRGFNTASDYPLFRSDFEFYERAMAQRARVRSAVRRYNVWPDEAHGGNVGIDQEGRITIYDMQSWATHMRFDRAKVRTRRTITELVERLRKIVLQPTVFDATGIDTPGDPDM